MAAGERDEREWTDADYPRAQGFKIVCGGSWEDRCEVEGLAFLAHAGARRDHRDKTIGFRCVRDAGR